MPTITRLGLQLPNFNYPDVPAEKLFGHLSEIAATAEASDFDSLWVMDHLHQIAGVGPETNWMLEGNTILGAFAARTERLALGLMVGGVTYRNPALLAKITTTLDIISGGRAILGIGAAWFEGEHLAYGFEFPPLKERFERLEDALNILRTMFTQEQATYEGTRHSVRGAYNYPRPIRGDIPIMIGGSGEKKTLRMVAQYGDACNIFGDVAQIRHLLGVLDDHCERLGRDPAEITKTRLGTVIIGTTAEEAGAKAEFLRRLTPNMPEERRRAMQIVGDPDTVAEKADALFEAGLDGLLVNLPDAHNLETVALVGETLGRVVGARF
ncbi:MAG TPA: LLM class F420-dependent oxidoreductase [Solirubrobacteraceae bacterium]|jgi:F420-dependent oxidoreductase-like protein|nr:LLM class F420-dependent oxidoreductase [Solirubrobacteraceae bacterium]